MNEQAMKTFNFGNWRMMPTILVSLIISACHSRTGQPATAISSSTATSESTAILEAEPVAVELVLGSGPFYLPEPRVGLDGLSSFQSALTVTFEGSEGGQAKAWTNAYVLLQNVEPFARTLTVASNQEVPAEGGSVPSFLGEMDGAAMEIGDDGLCSFEVLDPEASRIDWWQPVGLLSGLLGADQAGQEEVNGMAADHYTFDERALALYGVAESTGEVWVSADGGYILKYALTSAGGEELFGEGIEGTLTWDYALNDINQPLVMELPAACQERLVPAPRLPDATHVRSLPDWLRFNTSVSMEEASAFYQEQLPSLGWALTNAPPIAEMAALAQMTPENLILLEFAKGDQGIVILISLGASDTEVDIVLTDAGS